MLNNSAFNRLPVRERSSGLLIPIGAEVVSANQKIADNYRKDASHQAVTFMKKGMSPEEIASFLSTKNHSATLIESADD